MTVTHEAVGVPRQSDQATALWIESAGHCALRQEELPQRLSGEVRVRALFSGVSRGTEALVFYGQVPETEFDRMRGPHQMGEMSFPVKYGYAVIGLVEEGPEALVGKKIFCLHPHQDQFCVPVEEVQVLPDNLPSDRAVLAANMETALNIVWDAGVLPGDRVAVFGAGVVGLLVAYVTSRVPATETVICDTAPTRADVAKALGITFCSPSDVPEDCDILINASASPAALQNALSHAGFEARIVEASWYGDKIVELPLGRAFHAKRLSIISSQVGAVAAVRRARWSFGRRMGKALQLLGDERLDNLISGETSFASIPDVYGSILGSPKTLCHRIRY
ncbi:zinc-dependent alcohol dehydrogenase [Rhizobium halophilum]|uniref:zinc-dependent alcohol dehydrogenase n=1 Tax=Rhizobium halophilum TaxID=2846852 RepID=UPI001EFE3269|nr:zinc-binding alcohol dehydrogenase [Rhizobium halophilum]MCF6368016.1 zinc-binding alcohol dehydrogenase [Rhizobium halophilum]